MCVMIINESNLFSTSLGQCTGPQWNNVPLTYTLIHVLRSLQGDKSARTALSSLMSITNWRRHEYNGRHPKTGLVGSLPYHHPDPKVCPCSFRRRITPRPLPLWLRPLPVDSPHLTLLSGYSFPPTRYHTCNSQSAHGLHMLPHPDSHCHHFFEILIHFLRVPPPAN
jgi:hypothetical protein